MMRSDRPPYPRATPPTLSWEGVSNKFPKYTITVTTTQTCIAISAVDFSVIHNTSP